MSLELVIKVIKQEGLSIDEIRGKSYIQCVYNKEIKQAYTILNDFLNVKKQSSQRLQLVSNLSICSPANGIYRYKNCVIANQFEIKEISEDFENDGKILWGYHQIAIGGKPDQVEAIQCALLDLIKEKLKAKGIDPEKLGYAKVENMYYIIDEKAIFEKYASFLEKEIKSIC